MRLIIEDLEGSTTVVNLGTEDVTIGRKPHNTIQLTEQNVSRSHAKLVFQDDGWLIEDLGSYNGVRINGVPIHGPTLLRESDLIQIGDYHLTLTDDVDRATVDIGPRAAANDGMMAGAMGASSELPSVSVEDLTPMRPPNMAPGDSAAYHVDSVGGGPDEDKKSKAGLIIGIVGAVLAVGGIAIWLVSSGGDKPKAEVADQAGKSAQPKDADLVPRQTSSAAVAEDSGAVADGSDSGKEIVDTDSGTEIVETDGGTEIVDTDGGTEIVDTDGGTEIVDTDGGTEPEPQKSKPHKSKPHNKPQKPKLPPDEALAAARKASLTGNNKKAYSLAKDAYDQSKRSDALNLMGIAACKMSSSSKAKAAYRKMTNAKDKQNLEKVCKPLGIELQ